MGVFDFLGGILGGGADVAASVINANAARDNNAAQIAEADKQMAFQREMSNTAYQRSTADLRAAGLNPMLAYQNGGASTPPGAQATLTAPRPGDALKGVTTGINTAMNIKSLSKDLEQKDAMIELAGSQKAAAQADASLKANNSRVAALNAATAEAQLPAVQKQAENDLKRAQFDSKAMTYDNWSRRVFQATGAITDAISAIKPKVPNVVVGPRGRPQFAAPRDPELQKLYKAGAKGIPVNDD